MTESFDWRDAPSPSLDAFDALASQAWGKLPGHFRQMCGDLVIRVDDFATDDVLDEMGIEDAYDLMGLYQGVSLNNKSISDPPRDPDMVFLYRRPILDYWCEGDEKLGDIITHVLVHEIGHHFGFSDDDMEDIEAQATG